MQLIGTIDGWGVSNPGRLAFKGPRSILTYGELRQMSDKLALYLNKNVERGLPIIVLGHKDREQLVAFLACAKSGHAFIPVDDKIPTDRLSQIAEISRAGLILDDQRVRSALSKSHIVKHLMPRVRGDDCFYIMFTSGSTGSPKGVMISIRNVEDFVEWMLYVHRFDYETFLNVAPFSFDLSVLELWCGLASGSTIFSISRRELERPDRLFNTLRQSDATVWVSTPSFAQMALMNEELVQSWMPRLRKLLFCGERLQVTTAQELIKRFPKAKVFNMYGPTEACCAVTSVEIDRAIIHQYATSTLPVGIARPGTKVIIDGQEGEVILGGRQVGLGYLRSAGGFYEDDGVRYYRTGDQGYLDPATSLLFVQGRLDSQVKVKGHRIELGDIEANFMRIPVVNDVVVGLTPKGRLIAVVLPLIQDYTKSEEVREQLANYLPDYMIPSRIEFVTEFPRTSNGKIDRQKTIEEALSEDG